MSCIGKEETKQRHLLNSRSRRRAWQIYIWKAWQKYICQNENISSNKLSNLTDQQVEADKLAIVNDCPFRDAPVKCHQTFFTFCSFLFTFFTFFLHFLHFKIWDALVIINKYIKIRSFSSFSRLYMWKQRCVGSCNRFHGGHSHLPKKKKNFIKITFFNIWS